MSSIDSLLGRGNAPPALVTYALAAGMLVVSVPTFFFPELNLIFGGIGLLRYPWQVFTSAFVHGWPGVPLLPHLVGNLFLLGIVGVAAEKLLGSGRFLLLTAMAFLCYWLARIVTGIDTNGSSIFIWSYAPVVFLAIHHTAGYELPQGPHCEKCKGAIIIMWGLITAVMGVIMSIRGVNPWYAVAAGNTFHIAASVAGFAGAWVWRDRIRARLTGEERAPARIDAVAGMASYSAPLFLLVLLLLCMAGVINWPHYG